MKQNNDPVTLAELTHQHTEDAVHCTAVLPDRCSLSAPDSGGTSIRLTERDEIMRVKLQPGIGNDAYHGIGAFAGPEASLNAGGAASAPNIGLTGAIAGPDAGSGTPPSLYSRAQNPLAMPGMTSPDGMQTGTYDPASGPLTNRVIAHPDGSHDIYSFDATNTLRAGQNYDANGHLASSFTYAPDERGGALTYTRFNPDGSAQVDKAGGGLHTSFIASSDGQIQNLHQEALSPADAQKLEQWKASAGQLGAVASNLAPGSSISPEDAASRGNAAGPGGPGAAAPNLAPATQPAPASDVGGGDMAGIGTQQPPAPATAATAPPTPVNDDSGNNVAAIGSQQPPAPPPAPTAPSTAPSTMDNGTSGNGMASLGDIQRLASQLTSIASGIASERLPKIASDLKNLIEQLFSSAMPNPPAQPGASPAEANQTSLTTAGS